MQRVTKILELMGRWNNGWERKHYSIDRLSPGLRSFVALRMTKGVDHADTFTGSPRDIPERLTRGYFKLWGDGSESILRADMRVIAPIQHTVIGRIQSRIDTGPGGSS